MNDKTASDLTRPRSPNYPAFSIGRAIEIVRKVYQAEKRWGVPTLQVCQHAGLQGTESGPAKRTVSALTKFGLLELKNGLLQFTELGKRFALGAATEDDVRTSALKYEEIAAALEKYPDGFPEERSILQYLQLERAFTAGGAHQFAPILLETAETIGAFRHTAAPEPVAPAQVGGSHSASPIELPKLDDERTTQVWDLGGGVRVELAANKKLLRRHYEIIEAYVGVAKMACGE